MREQNDFFYVERTNKDLCCSLCGWPIKRVGHGGYLILEQDIICIDCVNDMNRAVKEG